jgi:electron transport complex protein RnfG
MKKILPALTLIIICTVSAVLLSFVHDMTYVDTEGVITEEVSTALDIIYGKADTFTVFTPPDPESEASAYVSLAMKNDTGAYAFLIVSDGYSNDGLTLLIGLDQSGAVKGIVTVESAETPGLGSKTDTPEFREQFIGYTVNHIPETPPADNTKYKVRFAKDKEEISKLRTEQPEEEIAFNWDAVTGATMSSNGMVNAVQLAVKTYWEVR